MNTIENIHNRRSIRKFTNEIIPRSIIDGLLICAIKSPSAKNRQPWKYTVCDNVSKHNVIRIMENELNDRIKDDKYRGSLKITIDAVSECSHLILVENRFTEDGLNDKYRMYADIQSIGSSIQNLCLAANELNIGSLWICDIHFCDDKIKECLNIKNDIIAAVALGYPNECPKEKPRINTKEIIEFVSDNAIIELFDITKHKDYIANVMMNRWECTKEYALNEIERYSKNDNNSICYVLTLNNKPIGCAAFDTINEVSEEYSPWNLLLWVEPEYRGYEYGRKLTQKRFEWAKQHGYNTIYLDTIKAKDYNLKMGWKLIETINENNFIMSFNI